MVEAKNLIVEGGAQIQSASVGPGAGGAIQVTAAETVTLRGTSMDGQFVSGLSASTRGTQPGAGSAGNIIVKTKNLTVEGGSQIASATNGPGAGGSITVTASETVTLTDTGPTGFPGGLFVNTISTESGAGNAGDIAVGAKNITLEGGAQFASSSGGPGAGGNITVKAIEAVTLIGTSPDGRFPSSLAANAQGTEPGAGNAGEIVVEARNLSMEAGAQIQSSSKGPGTGGNITVRASEAVTLTGIGPTGLPSGLFVTADGTEPGAGNAGEIVVEAKTYSMGAGALITSSSEGPGAGGSITITASELVRLMDDAEILAKSRGAGDAGDITINAGRTFRSINSEVSSEATQASGGNLTVIATDLIHLTNSKLNTSVAGGPQTIGGNILIDPQFVVLQNSQIVAQAFQGQGGNIIIQAGTFMADPASLVSASSQLGISGSVNIQAPLQNLSGALVPLQQGFLPVTTLHAERCAARVSEGKVSTFVVTLREGLPPEPGGPLPSPLEELDLSLAQTETQPLLLASGGPFSTGLTGAPTTTLALNQTCRR